MGSDQSKHSDDKRTSSGTEAAQHITTERPQQPYSYTQINLMTTTSPLYPQLHHVITHNYPTATQIPSYPNGQDAPTQKPKYNVTVAQKSSTASAAQTASYQASPNAQGFAYTARNSASAAQSPSFSTPGAGKASIATQESSQSTPELKATFTSPRPNTVSNDGFVVISSAELLQPAAAVNQPSARPLGFKKKGKAAARRPRSCSRDPSAAAAVNINCQTCDQQYTENIYRCDNGHSACEGCKERGAFCRLCKKPITEVRNYSLQDVVCNVKTACYNASEGCKLSFKIGDMGLHLCQCPFGELDCPLTAIYGRCTWRGKISQLVKHFDMRHPENRQGNVDEEMLLSNIYYDEKYTHLVEIGCYKFLVHLRVSEIQRNIYFTVQLIGTNNSANNWTYEIHVYNKREPRRKYMFSDGCYPLGTSAEEIFQDAKCAVLPLPMALSFINEGALTYKFYIKKYFGSKELSKREMRTKAWRDKNNKN